MNELNGCLPHVLRFHSVVCDVVIAARQIERIAAILAHICSRKEDIKVVLGVVQDLERFGQHTVQHDGS